MSDTETKTSSAESLANFLPDILGSAGDLIAQVGPVTGLIVIMAILLFFPKYGFLISLARLLKEDRADSRKREVEKLRLEAQLAKRDAAAKKPKRVGKVKQGADQLPPPDTGGEA